MARRVNTGIDINRLAQGLSRPGIDPRIWVSMAVALGEGELDAQYGWFVDVCLIPTGEEMTCFIPQMYAGNGFGESEQKVHKDDQLWVIIPNGDPANGGIAIGRQWTKVDAPPQLAADNPGDYVRVQETDTSYRLKLQGEGEWQFEGEAEVRHKTSEKHFTEAETVTLLTEKVRLGEEGASQQLILGTKHRANQKTMNQGLITDLAAAAAGLQAAQAGIIAAASSLTTAGPLTLLPPAGIAISAAATTLNSTVAPAIGVAATQILSAVAKITTFEASAAPDDYLSNVSKTK